MTGEEEPVRLSANVDGSLLLVQSKSSKTPPAPSGDLCRAVAAIFSLSRQIKGQKFLTSGHQRGLSSHSKLCTLTPMGNFLMNQQEMCEM